MKITKQILHLPPHLSTSWKNVQSLSINQKNGITFLVVFLQNNCIVEIPNLPQSTLDEIFATHAAVLEQNNKKEENKLSFGFPLDIPSTENISSLQHNPAQANFSPLPPEILKKLSAVIQALGQDAMDTLTPPEPNCNCPYCQLARSLNPEIQEEEPVSEADLTFKNWDIKQIGDKLYLVSNPLDEKEQYNVFLGNPLGCTCGEKNCEHLQAVLHS